MSDVDFESSASAVASNIADEPPSIEDRQKDDFDFSGSMLFAQTNTPIPDSLTEEAEESFQSNTASISRTQSPSVTTSSNIKPMQAKLFSGNIITLQPRTRKKKQVDIENLALNDSDGIVNMDHLFSVVSSKKKTKESRQKLRALEQQEAKSKKPEQLWTDKYKPRNFINLCSAGNDKQYRLVLHWLKKWSKVVFGEDQGDPGNTDQLGRPYKKILLVHGPLGIGKSAAVHLLVKQCGYNVQELNAANSLDALPLASSIPGGNTFSNASAAMKLKIMNALTTNSISANGAPSCLIIDEIDTILNSNDVMKVLTDICTGDQRATAKAFRQKMKEFDDDGKSEGKKKGNKKKDFILNRPIICIANDIYSTNNSRSFSSSPMERLRPLCEIVAFKKPQFSKAFGVKASGLALRSVKDHLMNINEREKLGLDYQQIGEIVEVCEGDIRASLNHLQFSGRKLDDYDIKESTETRKFNKDSQLSWFALVDLLFKRDPQASKDENFEALLDLVLNGSGKSASSSSGSLDKVVRGCFHKYLDVVHLQDDSLVNPSELSDWFYYYDSIHLDHDANRYSSLFTMKVWSLLSEINPKKNIRENSLIPNARGLDFESFEELKYNKSILKKLLEGLPLSAKLSMGCGSSENSKHFSSEILPYFDSVLNPDFSKYKPSKEFEKEMVAKVAQLVHKYNLTLESHKDLETRLETLHISPGWDQILNFDNHLSSIPLQSKVKIVQSRRQKLFPLIQSEIHKIIMEKRSDRKRTFTSVTQEASQAEGEAKAKKANINPIDFFKEKYDGISSQIKKEIPSKGTRSSNHEATRIWIKYNEGFSNAVRKNIGWADLWNP